jgi:uncharacterized protein (TIGR03067 family)
MYKVLMFTIILLLIIFEGCVSSSSVSTEKQLIQGEWVIRSAVLAGKSLPLSIFKESPLKLQNGKYDFQNDHGEYVLNLDGSPKELDVLGKEGPNAGKTILSIFILDRDSLVICYDMACKSRPLTFESTPGSKIFLARYRREK